MSKKEVILEALVDLPEYINFEKEEIIHIKENAFFGGHAYGYEVGRIYDDGEVVSFLPNELYEEMRNGKSRAKFFEKLKHDVNLIEKRNFFADKETFKMRGATRYFLPYRVKGHSSTMPTVTENHVDNCSNVEYSVAYEVLFVADEGYKRYLTVEYKTEGSFSTSFWDHMQDMEEFLENMFDTEEDNGFYNHGDYRSVTFYDDAGDVCDIELSSSSVNELLSMIASIRVIKCDHKIID